MLYHVESPRLLQWHWMGYPRCSLLIPKFYSFRICKFGCHYIHHISRTFLNESLGNEDKFPISYIDIHLPSISLAAFGCRLSFWVSHKTKISPPSNLFTMFRKPFLYLYSQYILWLVETQSFPKSSKAVNSFFYWIRYFSGACLNWYLFLNATHVLAYPGGICSFILILINILSVPFFIHIKKC